jgi:hypothetical protein
MSDEKLFSYGTLRYKAVQLKTFGRELQGMADILEGYRLDQVQITDPKVIALSGESVHKLIHFTGNAEDKIEGIVFDLSSQELVMADSYEVDDYRRFCVKLKSGVNAWVYGS